MKDTKSMENSLRDDDLSLEELVKRSDKVIEEGGIVFTKFTCEHCGSRQTGIGPNTVHSSYTCEECGKITRPKKFGMMTVYMSDRFRKLCSCRGIEMSDVTDIIKRET